MSRRGPESTSGRRGRRQAVTVEQSPTVALRNPYQPFEILSRDQVEAIHRASLRVLEEIGVNFLLPEAIDILRAAGADVGTDGIRVRFDPAFVEVVSLYRAVSGKNLPVNAPEKMKRLAEKHFGPGTRRKTGAT